MVAFDDLKFCKVCCGICRPAVGHQFARLTCQRTLVVLKGISCLEHIGNCHLTFCGKADGIEFAARKLYIIEALGIDKVKA